MPAAIAMTFFVLSDSYNHHQQAGDAPDAADDQTSGDLPPMVTVLDDDADCTGNGSTGWCTDEGRAMMQIVHDVAPGAALAFHTAFSGIAGFAEGIRALARSVQDGGAGAKVIVDDVLYLAEPMFQDGAIAKAVDEVVSTRGVAYFSSAGNAPPATATKRPFGAAARGS